MSVLFGREALVVGAKLLPFEINRSVVSKAGFVSADSSSVSDGNEVADDPANADTNILSS